MMMMIVIILLLFVIIVLSDNNNNNNNKEYDCKCQCISQDKCNCNCIGLNDYERCKSSYGNVTFISHENMPDMPPPILIAMPGTSTYVRLLVEYATGIVTGSIDVKSSSYLKSLFKGESACGKRTILVKGSPDELTLIPTEHEIKAPKAGHRPGKLLHFQHKDGRKKCNRGMIHYFDRLIFLSRDPYETIYSIIQSEDMLNKLSDEEIQADYNTYVEGIYDSLYPPNFWENVGLYNVTFRDLIEPSIWTFDSHRRINIKYEDLLDEKTMMYELKRLISFLGLKVTQDRMRCSFLLAAKFKLSYSKNMIFKSPIPNHAIPTLCKLEKELYYYQNYFNYTTPTELKCSELSWQLKYKKAQQQQQQQQRQQIKLEQEQNEQNELNEQKNMTTTLFLDN